MIRDVIFVGMVRRLLYMRFAIALFPILASYSSAKKKAYSKKVFGKPSLLSLLVKLITLECL